MKKDDYHVIVYRILSHLYRSLKTGEDVDLKKIFIFKIPKMYYFYIMKNLIELGYIKGVTINTQTRHTLDLTVGEIEITPQWLLYLQHDDKMHIAKRFVRTCEILDYLFKIN